MAFDRDEGFDYTCYAARPLTAEAVAKLPDPAFAYRLHITVGPDTPPEAVKALGRLHHLRSVVLGPDSRVRRLLDGPIDLAPFVAALAAVPNLESLGLDYGDDALTDAVAEQVPSLRSLRRFGGRGPLTDAGLKAIARHAKLEAVTVGSKEVTDAGLAYLAGLPNLRSLGIQECPKLTSDGLRHLARTPRLTFLAASSLGPADDAVDVVAGVTTLERLWLSSFRDVPADRAIRALAGLPRLREVHWPSFPATDADLKGMAALPALKTAGVHDARLVTDAGVRELARSKSLKTVSLSRCGNLTDAAFVALAGLPRLETLRVSGAGGATDAGLKALTRSATLSGVDFEGVPVTEAGIRAFVVDRGRQLKWFGVGGPVVTDAVVSDIADRCPDLRNLNLYRCPNVTPASVGPIARLTKLRHVNMSHTGLTPDEMDEITRRLPDCRVSGPGRVPKPR